MEKLTQSQERAVAAIHRQMGFAKMLGFMAGKELKRICLREPKSARRVLKRLGEGVSLKEAERFIRAKGRSGESVGTAEMEALLRELYGLDEPVNDGEPAEEEADA